MTKKSIVMDLDDPRTATVAAVISNKTCKLILGELAEKDLSESELAQRLATPLSTVEYNLKKLIEAGLVDKTSTFFWSRKGKKVPVYKVSNKRIIIAPRTLSRGIVPAVIVSAIVAASVKFFSGARETVSYASDTFAKSGMAESAPSIDSGSGNAGLYSVLANAPNSWAWFLIGALTALLVFLLWNWKDS